MPTSMFTRVGAMLLTIAALAVGVAACGDDSSDGSTSTDDVKPVAEIADLSGVDTSVALDQGFLDALEQLKVTPAPAGDATLKGTDISFPITGGNVTYYDPSSPVRPYVQGTIDHDGSGLTLTAGKTEVELSDFVIDPGESTLSGTVSVNGKEAANDALLFDLDGTTLEPLKTNSDGSATLTGTTVKLADSAADLLNETFGIKDLQGGLVIGVSTITVK
ncbi:MAG: hypothetical protein KDB58_08380 [Solirubrobacterales bacterium]|nr:hypothetical protein [Solirubrobacterales bacterium]